VVVTKREFDSVIVWNEYIYAGQATKLKKLKPPKRNEHGEEETGKKIAA
jgi:hypothetical protein